jgi:ribokinase
MAGRVLVVGAINVDLVIIAPHLPAPGETVVGGGLRTFGGGKGANAAVAASRAGANVTLIGAVGADESGRSALDSLRNDGVDTSGVIELIDEPTGTALIVVDEKGENQIALGAGANGAVSPIHVRAALTEFLLTPGDVVLVSTEIPYDAVAAAIEVASNADVMCVLNPAPVITGLENLLTLRCILTPNEIELSELARKLVGISTTGNFDEIISENLHILSKHTQAPIIATLGSAGCAVLLPGGKVERFPNRVTTEVIDTTGAGDTFNGVLVACLAANEDVMTAVNTASLAASLSIGAVGAREGMPDARAITRAKNDSTST